MKFTVTITDDQARDLEEIAHASGWTMAQLVGGAVADRLFSQPVDCTEEPDDQAPAP